MAARRRCRRADSDSDGDSAPGRPRRLAAAPAGPRLSQACCSPVAAWPLQPARAVAKATAAAAAAARSRPRRPGPPEDLDSPACKPNHHDLDSMMAAVRVGPRSGRRRRPGPQG